MSWNDEIYVTVMWFSGYHRNVLWFICFVIVKDSFYVLNKQEVGEWSPRQ